MFFWYLIVGVIFPPKDEIGRAEEIVEGLKNLKRLANTTVDGVFVAECPVCAGKSNIFSWGVCKTLSHTCRNKSIITETWKHQEYLTSVISFLKFDM